MVVLFGQTPARPVRQKNARKIRESNIKAYHAPMDYRNTEPTTSRSRDGLNTAVKKMAAHQSYKPSQVSPRQTPLLILCILSTM